MDNKRVYTEGELKRQTICLRSITPLDWEGITFIGAAIAVSIIFPFGILLPLAILIPAMLYGDIIIQVISGLLCAILVFSACVIGPIMAERYERPRILRNFYRKWQRVSSNEKERLK